jgi:mono/diheme cytochrome c family protein
MAAVRTGFPEAHFGRDAKRASMWFLFVLLVLVIALVIYGGVGQPGPAPQSVSLAVASAGAQTKADAPSEGLGEQIYNGKCSGCHRKDGRGVYGLFAPLAKDPVVTQTSPRDVIQAVLFGRHGSIIGGVTYRVYMPPWAGQLSDKEIAAVINFVRSKWGNNAPPVTPAEVAKIRSEGSGAW